MIIFISALKFGTEESVTTHSVGLRFQEAVLPQILFGIRLSRRRVVSAEMSVILQITASGLQQMRVL